MERPTLETASPEVVAYIEYLEQLLEGRSARPAPNFEVSEAPNEFSILTVTEQGIAKRTPRHLYLRQRRAGMGVFDIDTPESDPPAHLLQVQEGEYLIVITTLARAFRIAVSQIPLSQEIREKGQSLLEGLPLEAGERLAVLAGEKGGMYLTVLSERGWVRSFPKHLLGENMKPGLVLYNLRENGKPTAACRHASDDHLLIATRQAMGIRFSARHIATFGCQGIRLATTDAAIAIAPANLKDSVLLVAEDGKGTIREMNGFAENKAPNAGGKQLLKADALTGLARIAAGDDVFIISRLGKIVRFAGDEIPPKEGVVQGVNCMTLRADSCVALLSVTPQPNAE